MCVDVCDYVQHTDLTHMCSCREQLSITYEDQESRASKVHWLSGWHPKMEDIGPSKGRVTRSKTATQESSRKGFGQDISAAFKHSSGLNDLYKWKQECGWTAQDLPWGVSAQRKLDSLANPDALDCFVSHAAPSEDEDMDVDEHQAGPAPPH